MTFYGSGTFYGAGAFYSPSGTDTPISLDFYRTDTDNIYVFHWAFQPPFMSPLLTTFDYQLEIDTDVNFSAPTLFETNTESATIPAGSPFEVTTAVIPRRILFVESTTTTFNEVVSAPAAGEYSVSLTTGVLTFNAADASTAITIISVPATSGDITQFQRGCVVKGFTVPVFTRAESAKITFFARVRIKDGLTFSPFSTPKTVNTIEDVTRETADRLITALPDRNVYPHDEALIPLASRTKNIAFIDETYATEFDLLFLEKEHTIRDTRPERTRDARLFDVVGQQFGFQKPNAMQFVDYRLILENMRLASCVGGTFAAIRAVGRAFTGVDPTITPFSDLFTFVTEGVISESLTIPGSGPFDVILLAPPRDVPVIPGFTFVDRPPTASGEFDVDFSTGTLTFDSSDASTAFTVTYSALSTIPTTLLEHVETFVIPAGSPFEVTLANIPLSVPTIPGFTFTFGTPGVGEFSMNFSTGVITFDSSAASTAITATYISSTTINPIVFSRLEAGFSVRIELNNPALCTLDLSVISFLLKQVLPAHTNFSLLVV